MAIPTPITPTRAAASNSTTAPATGGCALATTTSCHRLLHQEDLPFFAEAAPRLDRLRPILLGDDGRDVPESHVSAWPRRPIVRQLVRSGALPTIWDRLAERGVESRYYFSDVPFLALVGGEVPPIACTLPAFLAACATGTLPQVSFVEPRFLDGRRRHAERRPPACRHPGRTGVSEPDLYRGDHEPGVATYGLDHQLRRVGWVLRSRAADHGGPSAGRSGCGERMACAGSVYRAMVVSPFARRAFVAHHGIRSHVDSEVDRMAVGSGAAHREGRGGEQPGRVLDFNARAPRPPLFTVPPGPFFTPCSPSGSDRWLEVRDLARLFGWSV